VQSRLSAPTGMSFAEFTYQLLQGHDFAHLHATVACSLQVGGSDQWGNMLATHIGAGRIARICPDDAAFNKRVWGEVRQVGRERSVAGRARDGAV
jgi:hypothetical protein